jgi:ABC-type uncharacterized transport system permease subunit
MLLWAALFLYGLGVLLILPSVVRRRPALPRAALAALAGGLLLHGISLETAAVRLRHLPITDVRAAISFLAFDVTLAFFLVYPATGLCRSASSCCPLCFC